MKFHRATSHHDINLMMSIWAPGAVFNIDQQTLIGKAQIRHWFLTENKAFMPTHHWESDTPSYKIKVALNGDRATMYFECHYIDPKTSNGRRGGRRDPHAAEAQRAVADHELGRIDRDAQPVAPHGSQPDVLERRPPERGRAALGRMKGLLGGRRRARAGQGPNEAAPRVPRDRGAARARERPRPAACSDSRMRASSGSTPCSSARRSTRRSPRPPPTCRRCSPCVRPEPRR